MDPIKIMDEIERFPGNERVAALTVSRTDWHQIRTALERQAEELAQVTAKWESVSDYAKGCGAKISDLREKLAQKDARIARLESGLQVCLGFIEDHNPMEYMAVDEHIYGSKILNESPAQSAATLKAEALREVADNSRDPMISTSHLHGIADKIEREAHEMNLRENREAKEKS